MSTTAIRNRAGKVRFAVDARSGEDAAEGDVNQGDGYGLTPEQAAAIMADPNIAPDPTDLPTDVQQVLGGG